MDRDEFKRAREINRALNGYGGKMSDDELSPRLCSLPREYSDSRREVPSLERDALESYNPRLCSDETKVGNGFSDGSSCANGSTQLANKTLFSIRGRGGGGITSMDFTVSCCTCWQQYLE